MTLKVSENIKWAASWQNQQNGMCCPADAQADLRWAHIPFCWFCHEAAQIHAYLSKFSGEED